MLRTDVIPKFKDGDSGTNTSDHRIGGENWSSLEGTCEAIRGSLRDTHSTDRITKWDYNPDLLRACCWYEWKSILGSKRSRYTHDAVITSSLIRLFCKSEPKIEPKTCFFVSDKESIKHQLRRTNIFKKLTSFLDLGGDWDSYNAKPISSTAVDKTIGFLFDLFSFMEKKHIDVIDIFPVPLSSGGVQIEIETKQIEMEIEFEPDVSGRMVYLVEWKGKSLFRKFQEGIVTSTDQLLGLLG